MKGAVLAAIYLAGCGEGAPHGTFVSEDSAGVVVARNEIGPSDTTFLKDPVLRIGGSTAGEESSFQSIRDLAVLPGGLIAVVDPSGRVALFDSTGGYQGDLGRKGEGPGELLEPGQVESRADTLIVWDIGTRRLSLFTRAGDLIETHPLAKPSLALPLATLRTPATCILDEQESGQTFDPEPARAVIIKQCGKLSVDTLLGPYPVPEFGWRIIDATSQRGVMVMPPVFSVRPPWRLCEDNLLWANPTEPVVRFYDLEGNLKRAIHIARSGRQITPDDRRRYLQAIRARLNFNDAAARRIEEQTRFAEMAPVLTGIVCGADQTVWVADFNPGVPEPVDGVGNAWDVLADNGLDVRRVVFPEGFKLYRVEDDRAYGVARREFGVEVVEVYEVEVDR